nr:polysulfide reductase NrfD [Acidobacteriota bacterium]
SQARWVAAAGAALSPPLLIADLGRPERFLNMLRVFKPRSAMSMGAWTLVAFSSAAGAAAFADTLDHRLGGAVPVRVVADAAGALAAATGLVMATYTGVLVGTTAIPAWSENATRLPIHFAASGLASAVAVLDLLGNDHPALNGLGIGAAAVETAIGWELERRTRRSLEPLKTGFPGAIVRAGGVLSGPVTLILRTFAGRRRRIRMLAAWAAVAGSLLTRIGWVAAGYASSREPLEAVRLEDVPDPTADD